MLQYSIADISQITGIKTFTLRAWEKRYGIIAPQRTGTNIRKYGEADLHRLLAVSALVKKGYKISEVCDFSGEQIREKLGTVFATQNTHGKIGQLMKMSQTFDEKNFDKTLKHEIIESGIGSAIQNIIVPFMQEAENQWIADADFLCIKQFAYDLIRRRLIVASDLEEKENAEKILIFSPLKDPGELTLLITDFIIKKCGKSTVYCGENIPVKQVKKAYEVSSCKKIMLIGKLTDSAEDLQKTIENFDKEFPNAQKTVLHKNSEDLTDKFPQIDFVCGVEDLKQYLNEP